MSSFWNNRISISIFGESHGTSIGVVMDNLPPGEYIDMEKVLQFMARRAPKKDGTTTPRSEKDLPQVQSGTIGQRAFHFVPSFRIQIPAQRITATSNGCHVRVMPIIPEQCGIVAFRMFGAAAISPAD